MNPDPNQPNVPSENPIPEEPRIPVQTTAQAVDAPAPTSVPIPTDVTDPSTPVQPISPFFNPTNTATIPPANLNAPAGPAMPSTPVEGTYAGGSMPSTRKISKKLFLIIGAGVVLLLVVVAILVYFLYFNVTKADYLKAFTASSELVTLEAKSRDSLSSITGSNGKQPSFATVAESTKAVTDTTDAFTAYQTAVKSFDQQKALHDGDVGKAYKEFKTKYNAYQTYSLAYTKSINSTLAAFVKCSDIFKAKSDNGKSVTPTYDSYKKQSDDCRAVLVSAQNTSDPDWKSFITSYITYLDEGVPVYKNIYASIAANDYSNIVAKFGALTPVTKKFTDATKLLADSITKRFNDTDGSAKSFKVVTDLLDKKANQ